MKDLFKKSLATGVVLLFLATGFCTGVSDTQTIENQVNNDKGSDSPAGEPEPGTFVIEVKPTVRYRGFWYIFSDYHNYSEVDLKSEYKIQISEDDAEDIINTTGILNNELETSKNFSDKINIFNQELMVLRDAGILPSSFTMDNLTKTGEVFRDIASCIFNKRNRVAAVPTSLSPCSNSDIYSNWPKLKIVTPYIGFGTALIVAVPFGEITPIPFGPPDLRRVNSTEIPIFENQSSLNFTFYVGIHYSEILIGHSVAFGYAKSLIPFPDYWFAGSFYSVWGPNAGASITIYYMGPPIVTVFDLCIWGGSYCIILPFWFE